MGRRAKDKVASFSVAVLSLLFALPLVLILGQVTFRGAIALGKGLFSELLPAFCGTILLSVLALVFSVPLGVAVGLFLSEVRGTFPIAVDVAVGVLHGVPTIVVGVVVYLWVVKPFGGFSALSGACALALIMLPSVVKATKESVDLVPMELREASYALGASYSSTLLRVVLPSALSGITTGVLVGLSRAMGETAPLLFTAFGNPYLNLNPLKPVDALPLLIFNYAMSPYESWHEVAHAASFVLVAMVFLVNMLVRFVEARWRVRF